MLGGCSFLKPMKLVETTGRRKRRSEDGIWWASRRRRRPQNEEGRRHWPHVAACWSLPSLVWPVERRRWCFRCHASPSADVCTPSCIATHFGSSYISAAIMESVPSARRTTMPSSRPGPFPYMYNNVAILRFQRAPSGCLRSTEKPPCDSISMSSYESTTLTVPCPARCSIASAPKCFLHRHLPYRAMPG